MEKVKSSDYVWLGGLRTAVVEKAHEDAGLAAKPDEDPAEVQPSDEAVERRIDPATLPAEAL